MDATTIAHDFNNWLTVIKGYTEIARTTSDDAKRQSALCEVEIAIAGATTLTRSLLRARDDEALSLERTQGLSFRRPASTRL